MLLLVIRTIILYIITMIAMKAMGKRQLGQLQPFELVVILVISDLATLSMQNSGVPIVNSIIPIATITVLQISIAIINLKSEKARRFVCGTPSVILKNGEILEGEMRKLRMNVNDLLEQMRAKGFFDISEIEYAVMETNGQLSIMPRAEKRPLQPDDLNLDLDYERPAITLILDGKVNEKHLQEAGLDLNWLKKALAKHNIKNTDKVFFASIDAKGHLFCQLKAKDPEKGSPKPIRED
ncbi:MAG: DUF421 domain-containing protein [Clostridia bacterium]|jgi:uncharacterized membrane protein YcaP (DUF421 family)|nr:DUF421 domain-containing protein [Clostridia bacterium]MDD4571452.1 DUF421 domain-containing protein [Clostridia bacterium]